MGTSDEGVQEVGEGPHQLQGQAGDHVAAGLHGHLALPVEHRRVGQEVVVVGAVQGEEALAAALGQQQLVRLDGALVGLDGLVVVAQADVDVRRHVHQVAGIRDHVAQAVGRGPGPLGLGRGLHGVDVEVVGRRVARGAGQHVLQHGDDLVGSGLHHPVGGPQVPGPQVHQGLGEERPHVGVGRIRGVHLAHGVGVGPIQAGAVLGRRPGIALRQGRDQGPLDRGRRRLGQLLRPGHGGVGGAAGLLVHHGVVDVQPVHVGDAPLGHGAGRGPPRRRRGSSAAPPRG